MWLVPNIDPLLQTPAKLCVNPIDTSHDIDVLVSFNWKRNDNANDNDIDNGN